jgi:hypothetical protein
VMLIRAVALVFAFMVGGGTAPQSVWAATSTFVQSVAGAATGQTSATATLRATRAGSTIVVCVGSGEPITSISDNRANVYRLAGSVANSSGAGTLRVYHAVTAAGGVNTVTVTHAWGASDMVVAEYAESEVWIRGEYGHSGAPGAQKVIKTYPGEDVFLAREFTSRTKRP